MEDTYKKKKMYKEARKHEDKRSKKVDTDGAKTHMIQPFTSVWIHIKEQMMQQSLIFGFGCM